MKKLILAAAMVALTGSVFAIEVNVSREALGSGSPEQHGVENATKWDNDIYHAPQYMPGFPTAATLWPRVVDVRCDKVGTTYNCDGYHWMPDLGRGEYLMIRPMVKRPDPAPVTVTNTIIKEVPVVILKEVAPKAKKE